MRRDFDLQPLPIIRCAAAMSRDLLSLRSIPGVDRLVAGAVVHQGGQVLLLRRSPWDTFLPGIEELPSGGCEPGESLGDALARELHEEIGWVGRIQVDPEFCRSFDYVTADGLVARQYTFSLAAHGRDIRLCAEHTAWRWLHRYEVATSDLTMESADVLVSWWNRHEDNGMIG